MTNNLFSWINTAPSQNRWWIMMSSLLCWIMKISLTKMSSQLTKSMMFWQNLPRSFHLNTLTKDYLL